MRTPANVALATCVLVAGPAATPSRAESIETDLGRNEIRVWSAPTPLVTGESIRDLDLASRLEGAGYRRVRQRPAGSGDFFWGNEVFWIYRRAHAIGRNRHGPALLRLALDPSSGKILSIEQHRGDQNRSLRESWIEAELLSESLTEERTPRRLVAFDDLPTHVWRSLLAIEDSRFFDHAGVDARGVARAAVANAKAGGVTQGGSTITQQLVKLRDLSSKRTLGRKVSEAVRALALEAAYTKEEILAAYLNAVYYGHIDGVSIYGIGAAASAFYGKYPAQLSLAEAAVLAAIVQAPNRLSPVRNPQAARSRQEQVLDRLSELGWIDTNTVAKARRGGLPKLSIRAPSSSMSRHTRNWVAGAARDMVPGRLADGRGLIVETTLDPHLQRHAARTAREALGRLRRTHRSLRGRPLNVALVMMEARTGRVLAHVGGDPADPGDDFDRVARATRQPGSAVKPFVALEALEACGREDALHLATRVTDTTLTLDLPSGPWTPRNPDGRFRGVVDLRRVIVDSLNVPTVRLARHCGFEDVAQRFRKAGLAIPLENPPAFVLGAVEATPLQMAEAFTVFATLGERVSAIVIDRVRQPSGEPRGKGKSRRKRVSSAASAYLVRDVLAEVVSSGTARGAALPGVTVVGKTGTSSDRKDAWFVGEAGGWVAAVWVGMDDGSRLGLSAAVAAVPIWRSFMERAVAARPLSYPEEPPGIVHHWIDPDTGRRLKEHRNGAREELFRRRSVPPRRIFVVAQGELDPIH